jgi:hypothetical protein
MLIDRFLPRYDVTYVCETSVDAPPEDTYAAIRETNLRDPVIDALFAVRELPLMIARRLRGEPPPPAAPPKVTFGDVAPARRTFRRYWRLIAPGVGLVMRRAVRRIKGEAERRAMTIAVPR